MPQREEGGKQKGGEKVKAAIRNDMGETLVTLELDPKSFKTGSRGYFAAGKVQDSGKKYQVSVTVVEIHSKNGKGS